MTKLFGDKAEVARYGMVRGFWELVDIGPNEALGWAGWRPLSRPRRCLSRWAKAVRKRLVRYRKEKGV